MQPYVHFFQWFGTVLLATICFKQYRIIVTDLKSSCDVYNNNYCANGGLWTNTTDKGFVCKCTRKYYGKNCTHEKFWMRYQLIVVITRLFDNVDVNIRRGEPVKWWSVLRPFTNKLQLKAIYSFHQNQLKKLEMFSDVSNREHKNGFNMDTITRIMPPTRPLHCLKVDKNLPSLSTLYGTLFKRKYNQFKPDVKNRNLLFHAFYQYFVLQFFDANFSPTVTASQLYGTNKITKKALRSFSNGKLKTQYINNEHYPPYLSTAKGVKMANPAKHYKPNSHWFNKIKINSNTTHKIPKLKWAMGHPLLNMNPMLFVMSTLWIREHNRVCNMLIKKWPTWTDSQIYNTARRIIIGEMMGIMMNEIINVHNDFKYSLEYKPEIYHGQLQNISSSKTPLELLITTMWPTALPDEINNIPIDSMVFSNNGQVFADGMSNTVKYMVNQKMGMLTRNNDGIATEPVTKLMMKLSRENGLQSFNNYRIQLGLYPYETFYRLTRNWEIAEELKRLYGNVDNVELLTGILLERKIYGVASTASIMTNSFIINSILTNDLTSKILWEPITFGGNEGFDIVKTANIQKLVCNNLAGNCNGFSVKLYAD